MSTSIVMTGTGPVGTRYRQVRLHRQDGGQKIRPGQFVSITTRAAGQVFWTGAVVNYMGSEEHVDLLVSEGSGAGRASLMIVQPGDAVDMSSPMGVGYPDPLDDGYILVAGGSGIASIYPVVERCVVDDIPFKLLYMERGKKHAYAEALKSIRSKRAQVVLWDTSEFSRPDTFDVLDCHNVAHARVCACGPNSLLTTLDVEARAHGLQTPVWRNC